MAARALAALGASLQSGWDAKAYLGSGAAPASKELYGDAFDDSPPPQVTAAKRSDAKSAFELLVSRGKMDTAAFARDVDEVIEAFDRCNALTARPKVGFPLLDFLVYGTLLGTSLVGAALSAGLVDVNRAVATARRPESEARSAGTGVTRPDGAAAATRRSASSPRATAKTDAPWAA